MKKDFLLILSFFICTACGSHSQELFRIDSISPAKSTEEKDFTLILINAVNAGDLNKVKEAIEGGGDVNTMSNEGLTLIMIATRSQQFAVLEYLIQSGADVELESQFEPTTKVYDFIGGDDETVAILSAIINREELNGDLLTSSMYSAIQLMNIDNLTWLLEKGADPNNIRKTSSGSEKDTPLIYLFSLRGVEGEAFTKLKAIFELFVSHPSIDLNIEVKKSTALKKAQTRASQDPAYQPLVDKLISMGARG